MNAKVLGGQMEWKNLNSSLDEEKQAVGKAVIWLKMINDGMKPKKWLKTTKKGTKVNFDAINSQEEYDQEIDKLSAYIGEVNERFGTDLVINKNEYN